MSARRVAEFEMESSTLGELREIVAATADLPDEAELRVVCRIEFDMRGTRVQLVRLTGGTA